MTHSRLDSRRLAALRRRFWFCAIAFSAFVFSAIAFGSAPQQQPSLDSSLRAPRVGLLSLPYPEMTSLETDVGEPLQFSQEHLGHPGR